MKEITEDYVSFEMAKLLKEKGFDEDINLWYDETGEMFFELKYNIGHNWRVRKNQKVYECPTLQMATKWLLETHNVFITILQAEHTTVTMEQEYFFYRIQKNRKSVGVFTDTFMKPEQACEAAIKYCLENLI